MTSSRLTPCTGVFRDVSSPRGPLGSLMVGLCATNQHESACFDHYTERCSRPPEPFAVSITYCLASTRVRAVNRRIAWLALRASSRAERVQSRTFEQVCSQQTVPLSPGLGTTNQPGTDRVWLISAIATPKLAAEMELRPSTPSDRQRSPFQLKPEK